ncbi:MAG: hypothetical protein OJF60_000223 [Burkholderiaceae bacterium]|nr:MAG: hypothetical protein OJF60_000223 [Burkholderiaceae bacterium]
MSLPVNARIQAAQSFVRSVQSAREFLLAQDSASTAARYEGLLTQLKGARELLRWNPAAGRPARFLDLHAAQGQALAVRAVALASAHGVPQLRELVIHPYVLLYAHGDDLVVLLSLKHERQLMFRFE